MTSEPPDRSGAGNVSAVLATADAAASFPSVAAMCECELHVPGTASIGLTKVYWSREGQEHNCWSWWCSVCREAMGTGNVRTMQDVLDAAVHCQLVPGVERYRGFRGTMLDFWDDTSPEAVARWELYVEERGGFDDSDVKRRGTGPSPAGEVKA